MLEHRYFKSVVFTSFSNYETALITYRDEGFSIIPDSCAPDNYVYLFDNDGNIHNIKVIDVDAPIETFNIG